MSKPYSSVRWLNAIVIASLLLLPVLTMPPTKASSATPPPASNNAAGGDASINSSSGSGAAAPNHINTVDWVVGAAMPVAAYRYASATDGHYFYAISGKTISGRTQALQRYDPYSDSWTLLQQIPGGMEGAGAAYYNGIIYVAGGLSGSVTNIMQIYTIGTNSWSSGAAMVYPTYASAVGAYAGKVYVAGGYNTPTTLQIYDIASNTWSLGATPPAPIAYSGYTQVGQYLYVVGGYSSTPASNSNATMRLDLVSGQWSSGPAFTMQRADFALAYDGVNLYAIGGDANGGTYTDPSIEVDQYSLSAWPGGSWAVNPNSLPTVRQGNSAGFYSTARSGSEIWSTGGYNGSAAIPDNIYLAVPLPTATNTPVPPSATPTPTPTPPCPLPFIDINGNIFYGAIVSLYCNHVVNGTDATHYSPAGTSTRGQFAKVVVLGFGTPFYTPTGNPDFTDVLPTYFAYLYIESGYHAGILSGFDANSCYAHGLNPPCYLPNLPITRGQLTKLVVNAGRYPLITPTGGLQTFTDVPPSNIFFVSIETAAANHIVGGYSDHTFRPNNNIRRDEMAQIVYKGTMGNTTPTPGPLTSTPTITYTPTPTETPGGPTDTPTSTPTITSTPTPTWTPGGPSATPSNTATSTLTATPSPSPTPCSILGSWSYVASYQVAVQASAVASDGTYVYSAGGDLPSSQALNLLGRYDAITDSWSYLAPMPHALYYARATYALNTGRLYVFGGRDITNTLDTVYIYNPGTDSWSTGTPMPASRYWPNVGYYNGKIYVVGGFAASAQEQAQTWEYDPVANTWNTSRVPDPVPQGGSGTVVIDHYLYLMGGYGGSASNFNERYDITADTWTYRAPMPQAVFEPGAGTIDGQVYIFGGGNPYYSPGALSRSLPNGKAAPLIAYNTTQIYNPATDTWSSGPALNTGRSFTGGTAIGNHLIAVGGDDSSGQYHNSVELATASACPTVTPTTNTPVPPTATPTPTVTSTPVADPSPTPCSNIGSWAYVSNYQIQLQAAAVASDGTYVYAAGGSYFGQTRNLLGRYDPVANSWSYLAPMPHGLYEARAAYAQNTGKFYVFGGLDNVNTLDTVYIYDPVSNSWSNGAPMPAARAWPNVAYFNDNIYVVGGFDSGFSDDIHEQSQTWAYNPVANTWNTNLTADPVLQGGSGTAVIGHYLYLMGGYGGSASNFNERYDITSDAWTYKAPLPQAAYLAGAGAINGKIYIFGGGNPDLSAGTLSQRNKEAPNSSFNITQVYDIATDTWSNGPTLNTHRSYTGGSAVGNHLVVVGGYDGNGNELDTVELATVSGCVGNIQTSP